MKGWQIGLMGCGGLALVGTIGLFGCAAMIAGGARNADRTTTRAVDSNLSAPAPAPGATAGTAAPAQAVTVLEVARAYQANEAAAQQQYGGHPLRVTGTIASIDLDFMNHPVVHLRTDNQFMNAGMQLTEASQARAASLVRGHRVTALCQDVQEVMSIPQFSGCDLE